jgi:hypothetical protein
MAHRDTRVTQTAGLIAAIVLSSAPGAAASDLPADAREGRHWAGRPAGKPAYLWLWYADGKTQPSDDSFCTGVTPPPFKCNYGPTIEDCQRQVLGFLDLWYADFNLEFTLSRPPTGDYYTMVVTSEASWCSVTTNEAGVAPFNCNDNPGLLAYAFECGYSAHDCAALIAHEHGHLVGLEHTRSTVDIMNEALLPGSNGFVDETLSTLDLQCRPTQNSYAMMLAALGPWPGGAKPNPFASTPDAGAADAVTDSASSADAATSGSPLGPGGGIDGGPIGVVGGYDALARPTVPTVDAALAPPKSGGGCSHGGPRPGAGSALLALLGLLASALTRARVRRPGRLERRAAEPLPCAGPARWPSAARSRGRR